MNLKSPFLAISLLLLVLAGMGCGAADSGDEEDGSDGDEVAEIMPGAGRAPQNESFDAPGGAAATAAAAASADGVHIAQRERPAVPDVQR